MGYRLSICVYSPLAAWMLQGLERASVSSGHPKEPSLKSECGRSGYRKDIPRKVEKGEQERREALFRAIPSTTATCVDRGLRDTGAVWVPF